MADLASGVRLSRLHVLRYRSLKNTTVEPNPGLSVLVGPNGVGKTNILHAILLLRGVSRRAYAYEEPGEFTGGVSVEATYSVGGEEISYAIDFNPVSGERGLEERSPIRERWSLRGEGGKQSTIELPTSLVRYMLSPRERHMVARTLDLPVGTREQVEQMIEAGHLARLQPILSFNATLRYYSASHFTDPTKCPSSFEVEGDNELVDEYAFRGPHRAFIYGLYHLWKTDLPAYNQVIDVVGKDGIGLINEIHWKTYALSSSEVKIQQGGAVVRRRRRRTLVIPQVKVRQSTVAFNQLSEGTFKSLALVFYLLRDDWSMLLLEEPEVCVHHGLLNSIMELIKVRAEKRQIVISTHSEFVLDLISAEQMFPVSITRQGTYTARLDKALAPRDLMALRQYLEESGSLGEYWKHGGLKA